MAAALRDLRGGREDGSPVRLLEWFRQRFGLPTYDDGKPEPEPIMHWSPPPEHLPYCGASMFEPWTTEFSSASCKACKRSGLPLLAQYEMGNR